MRLKSLVCSLAALLGTAAFTPVVTAQSFSPSKMKIVQGGNNLTNKLTSIQFGPDNKLYFLARNGTIVVCDVTRQAKNNYVPSNIQTITLVKNIQNHDDDGALNNTKAERQATGLLVVGTAANPVIYVSSCDWREGAGSGTDGDINLDTNSGIISRLTKNGATWEKLDLVRGLPRSEENHACNGLQIDTTGTKLLLAQGGNTNAGSPSKNFAMACEYALSAAILSIDLPALDAMPVQLDSAGQKYVYNLPTVNDPSASRGDTTEEVVLRWTSAGVIQRVAVPGVNSVSAAAEGNGFTIALKSNNTVLAWGNNADGQTNVPAGLTNVFAVAAGASHSLALKVDGTVVAWGANGSTQATVPGGLSGVQRIAAGGNHSLALKSDGTVVGWGSNSNNQATAPVGLTGVQRIAAGGTHSLALKTDGTVVAWGNNAAQQATVPAGLSGVIAIAAGGEHCLALKSDGTVVAWGSNAAGQRTVPAGLTGVQAIAAGATHSVALKSDGTVVAWGDNGAAATSIPAGLASVDFISAGGSRTLAVNTRSVDVGDPFGGNDGLNQARLAVGEPVQIFASGFRNPYDILIAKTGARAGKMYTFDNAPNSGWGGHPKNEGLPAEGQPSTATNEYILNEAGTTANNDGLHLISQGYYGGHPNPIRANPAGAGWTWAVGLGANPTRMFEWTPTTDWPPVDPALADPREGDYRIAGLANGVNPPNTNRALFLNNASTTGMAEYTAPNFSGNMMGNIITTRFSGPSVQRLVLNADGTAVVSATDILGDGDLYGNPLDVAIPSAEAAPALLGTIFVAHYSGDGITILEPSDFETGGVIVCTGIDSYELDDDQDGYSNADEVDNGTDPCSPAVYPTDRDGDFLSDLADTDDDNDGVVDPLDAFPIDALNGTDVGVPVNYELFNDLNRGFFKIGFTGLMLNPGQNYQELIDAANLIGGGTAGLFTDPDIGPGNPRGASNNQINGFHFGVNVDESTGKFRARSKLGGIPFNGAATGNQSQGIFIGNGDQDNYVMVALHANGGVGGIEVVHEENGVVLSSGVFPAANILDGGTITLEFLVDPVAGTVQAGYAIGNTAPIYVGPVLNVGGKILNVLRGSSGMAFGLLATTNGGPTFNATWDSFTVDKVPNTASAVFTMNAFTGGSISNASTNTTDSFQVENTSTGGQKIVSVKVDVSSAMLPDVVFDPETTAGDLDGKAFQLDGFTGTGTPTGAFSLPHNGVNGLEGYSALTVTCGSGVDFTPGSILKFSSDIDPTNIKGVTGPGPYDSSSVCGLELTGSVVTVTFDDGTVRKLRVGMYPNITNVNGNENRASKAILSNPGLPTPKISVPGKTSPMLVSTLPTVRVAGPPGKSAVVWTFNAGLYLSQPPNFIVPNGGYDIDPFETNKVNGYAKTTVTIPDSGFVNVTLAPNVIDGGMYYHVAAILTDSSGNRSSASNVLTILHDPNAAADALVRVDAGSATPFTDSLTRIWAADNGSSAGTSGTSANAINGTTDDSLYQSFRTASVPLDYAFNVANGNYQVKLHFAETSAAVTAAGQRVFDVLMEDQLALNDLDVFAEAGANTALVKTIPVYVGDGNLKIGLRQVTGDLMVSAIEIYFINSGPPIDTTPPAAPASLATSNLKSGSVTLTWPAATDNVAVTGYRLFRNGSAQGTTATLSLAQTGLAPSTAYNFEVEAYDAAGNNSPRVALQVTTPADTENPTAPVNLKGNAGNASANLTWSPASDDTAVTGYRVYRDGNLLGTVTALAFPESGLTNGTNYTYQVIAIDATGKTSPPATVIVRPRAIAGVVLRLDTGTQSGVTTPTLDSQGNEWLPELDGVYNNSVGIVEPTSNKAIAGTTDDIIYQTRRNDPSNGAELKYTFPVPNGDYELRLHFAETTTNFQSPPGQRVFDVKVQNQIAIDDLDIVGVAGFATALVVPLPATVTNGSLTVEFIHNPLLNNPAICGIEIYALEPPPPDTLAPTVPGSLAVTGTTPGSVSLSWAASADNVAVAGYRVTRNGGTPVTVNSLTFIDSGLLPGSAYNYSVTAFDAAGNASAAATITGNTLPDTTPPSAPGSLAGASGNGNVTLSWTAATDDSVVTGYRIYRDNVLIETVSALNYTVNGLTNGTAYVFKVIAIDGFLNESAPAQVTVTPRALGPVLYRIDCGKTDAGYSYTDPLGNIWARDEYFNVANTNVTTVTNTITGTSFPEIYKSFHSKTRTSSTPLKYEFPVTNGNYEVRLHFAETSSSASVAVGYRIFNVLLEGSAALPALDVFAEAGGKNKALVKTLPAAITDGKVTLDFTNYYVGTNTEAQQNPFVSGIEIFPILSGSAGESQPPTVPGNLQASNVTGNSATLGWTASTDNVAVTGYRIYRNSVLIDTVTTLSFNNTGLASGTLYHYAVVAIDAANNASAPATVDVTTTAPDTQAPTTPGGLAATPGLAQVALAWNASTDNVGVTGYRVLRDGMLVTTVNVPGYTDTGLSSGTAYAYQVIAIDAANNASAPATANTGTTTDTQAPTVPGSLAATPSHTTVGLTWTASTDNAAVTGYRVYRGATLLATVTTLFYQDNVLTPGTAYHYEVRAIDTAGNASSAASVDTTTLADTVPPTSPLGFDATAGDGAVSLTWSAATDNVGVTGYEIRRNSVLVTTVTTPGYSDTGLVNGTLYLYEVRALDAAGNASAPASDSAKPRLVGPALYRVDAGNATAPFVDSLGNTWETDTPYYISGSNPSVAANPIAGTLDDTIYQTYRWDSQPTGANLAYNFAMTAGEYEVRLHFAETFAGAASVGGRLFDVRVDGNVVVDDLDIFARAGANTALVVSFPVSVTDGTLNLDFVHGVIQNPLVCGIEIFPILPSGSPSFEQWLTSFGLTGQTAVDSDGGGLSNLEEFELQMNPNDPNDDLTFNLQVEHQAGTELVKLPVLKPIGNYYVHRDNDLIGIGNIANRIDVITKAEIEGMTPTQRANYTIQDNGGGARAFYQLFFEPAP